MKLEADWWKSLWVERRSEREKKIARLKELAKTSAEASKTMERIREEQEMILKTPDKATECMVRRYNQFIRGADLPFAERQKLLMEEKY